MDPIAAYHQVADAIVATTGASRSLLHLHGGMLIYLACQVLLGTRRGSLTAILITACLVLLHEVLNRFHHGAWRWGDTRQDLLLSLFWPTMCYAVSSFSRWRWMHGSGLFGLAKTVRTSQPKPAAPTGATG